MMGLIETPAAPRLRPHETLVWQGQPCWRTLALRVFHIRAVGFYLCALVFANAVAARLAHLPPSQAAGDILPLLILGGLVLGATALAAWASGRTTVYTVTDQRVVLQFGIALNATVSIPMRVIASVAVSEDRVGDVPIHLKPGNRIAFLKLWPHVKPWRIGRPEPMLRAVPDAAAAAALLARTVEAAQSIEHIPSGRRRSSHLAPERHLV